MARARSLRALADVAGAKQSLAALTMQLDPVTAETIEGLIVQAQLELSNGQCREAKARIATGAREST